MSTALPPVRELVNVLEFEAAARQRLAPALFAEIASTGDRRAFDRYTFRPRLMRDVTKLDLGVELFGEKHFTPILLGPVQGLGRFHAEGEAAWRKGAADAKAVCWPSDGLSQVAVPKGILTAEAARQAVSKGAGGVIVSTYGVPGALDALEALPAVVDAVAGRVPVLVAGGFRRGTDIAKALALGARGVMIARPALWGLAAYGAEGVQCVVELLQSELARAVAMLGAASVAQLDRSAVRRHQIIL